jgi:glycosyltransferase involved in cell wall biosynthesis
MTDKIPLSVAMITKNEGEKLAASLQSVAFADQIVIIDTDSADRTREIAAQFGCDVYIEPWHGFGPQKQLAVDRCRHLWVLVLDADERIPQETAAVITEIVADGQPCADAFSFPRKNFFQGRWIRHAGWWPDRVVRLFRKDRGRVTPDLVHESIMVNGAVHKLDVPIEHDTESRLSKILQKIDHYSTLGAEEAFRKGKKVSMASVVLRAVLTFFQDYFLRLGILDGSQGLTLAITDAINKYFKYSKLHELNRRQRKHP